VKQKFLAASSPTAELLNFNLQAVTD